MNKFERSGEYDGVFLLGFIQHRVNPTTMVGASNYKVEIEKATLADHKKNIATFNTWFDDTQTKIIIKRKGRGI